MRVSRLLCVSSVAGSLWLAAAANGDTLVLRNGRHIEGTLVAVRGDAIEFDDGRRSERYARSEVRRIELDEDAGWSERRGRAGRRDSDDDAQRGAGGVRERSVSVDASTHWTDSGVDLRAGQRVRFQASGEVRWGPGRKDGPGGEGGSHSNAGRPMPNRPGAALIGRVGQGQDVFFIGSDEGEIRVRNSGRLYLGINDDYLQDNSGAFRVVVYY
jgi:hypothetical protein